MLVVVVKDRAAIEPILLFADYLESSAPNTAHTLGSGHTTLAHASHTGI